jgi:hypothetical protein
VEALAQVLTREHVLVELLVFKLVSMRQLLLCGETRFLAWAGEELERAATTVRQAELERAVVAGQLGAERGLPEPTLSELVSSATPPWGSLLTDLATSLGSAGTEVADLLATNRRLAETGADQAQDSEAHVGYAAALSAIRRSDQPSLAGFVS